MQKQKENFDAFVGISEAKTMYVRNENEYMPNEERFESCEKESMG